MGESSKPTCAPIQSGSACAKVTECSPRAALGDLRAPLVVRAEAEVEGGPEPCLARTGLGPPVVQAFGRAHGIEDPAGVRLDRKLLENVGHVVVVSIIRWQARVRFPRRPRPARGGPAPGPRTLPG